MSTIIAGLPDIPASPGANLGHIWALRALLEFMGDAPSDAWLVGITGDAGRLHMLGPEISLDGPHVGTGRALMRGLASLGHEARHHKRLDAGELLGPIAESVDQGMPVLARSTEGLDRWGLVAGYETDGRIYCRNTSASEGEYATSTTATMADTGLNGGEIVVTAPPTAARTLRDQALEAIAGKVRAAEECEQPGEPYIAYVRCLDSWDEARESGWAPDEIAFAYNVETWGLLKPLEAEFFAETLRVLDEPTRRPMVHAAEQFDIVGRNWDALRWLLGWGHEDALEDPAKRWVGANMLRDAERAEARGLAHLREALAASGGG
ncbi:MAG: hypothetical protein QM473_06430 [Acidobacteriota bacterium]|nr:hypothetical protein [Acidobacteriota bacterium]